jgi:RNA polymerase sigma-70 factor, ECF subfamily
LALNLSEVSHISPDGRDRQEEALVKGLAEGNPSSVNDFLRRTHKPVYAMTARLSVDPDQRHDWCQEILLKIIDEMASGRFVYQRPGCFWSWFQMRSNFLLINLYHKDKKHNDRWSTGEIGAALVEKMPLKDNADPLFLLEVAEARQVIEECLNGLSSQDQQRALGLVLLQEQSYQEVSEALNTSLNTVRSWIRRARIAMRQCVAGKFQFTDQDTL